MGHKIFITKAFHFSNFVTSTETSVKALEREQTLDDISTNVINIFSILYMHVL